MTTTSADRDPTRSWLTRNLVVLTLVSSAQHMASGYLHPLLPLLLGGVLSDRRPRPVVHATGWAAFGLGCPGRGKSGAAVTVGLHGRPVSRWG